MPTTNVDEIVKEAAKRPKKAKPVEAEKPKVEAAAETPAEPPKADEQTGPGRYQVGHLNCADAVFDAQDRFDAVEQYKAYAGIISTPHPFKVHKLPE